PLERRIVDSRCHSKLSTERHWLFGLRIAIPHVGGKAFVRAGVDALIHRSRWNGARTGTVGGNPYKVPAAAFGVLPSGLSTGLTAASFHCLGK
ncbi:MAG: hypothetical protein OEY99_05885, partial [Aigarchaeota archaeon]|nr:hypothetical protein [Aigarchaeota archaeon]